MKISMYSQIKSICMMCTINSLTKVVLIFCTISVCFSKTFRVAWMAPDKNSGHEINSFTSVAGLKLALSNVMANPRILNGHNIEVEYFPTDCTSKGSMQIATKAKLFNPDVVIGPPCQQGMRLVAQLCAYWNLPVFSWYNPGIEFDSTQTYPTLVRMIPSLSTMGTALLHLFRQNQWKQFSFLNDNSAPWTLYEKAVRSKVAHTEIQMLSSQSVNSTITDTELRSMFLHIKRYSYIVVFACPPADIRRYMLIADQAGMGDGNYIFIQLDHQLHTENVLNTDVLTKGRWMVGDAQDQAAGRIFKSLIHVLLDPMNDDEIPTHALPRNRYEEFTKMTVPDVTKLKPGWKLPVGGPPDVYSLYLYDAILVWTVLVDRLHSSGNNHRDGKLLAQRARNFLADGASGYFDLNMNQDRIAKLFVLYMENDGSFKPSQILKFNSSDGYDIINLKPLPEQLRRHGGQKIPNNNHINVFPTASTPVPTEMRLTSTPSPRPPPPPKTTLKAATKPSIPPPPPVLKPMNPQDNHREQTTITLINKLLAKVQSLEKTIKDHELHAHVGIPEHTHTPHPLLKHVTTPLSLMLSSNTNNTAVGVHNQFYQNIQTTTPSPLSLQNLLGHPSFNHAPHYPHQHHHVPTQATNFTHSVTDQGRNQTTNANSQTVYDQAHYQHHWHPHPHPSYPYQGQGNLGHVQGTQLNHKQLSTTYMSPSQSQTLQQVQTTQAPTTTTTTLSPITTTQAITTTPTTSQEQLNGNAPIDEALLDRISSRIVDKLTGTRASTNAINQEGPAVSDWFANGLDEIGPGLYFAAQAMRERQLIRNARQRLLQQQLQNNNQNNQERPQAGWHPSAYRDPVVDTLAGLWGPSATWR